MPDWESLGTALGYVWGNCTAFVAGVTGWIPRGMGNAYQWFGNAASHGLATTQTPTAGSVVVFGSGLPGSGGFGHVAVVQSVQSATSFTVQEANFKGLGQTDTRFVPNLNFVEGFILPPGGHPGNPAGAVAGAVGQAANPLAGIADTLIPGFGAIAAAANPLTPVTSLIAWATNPDTLVRAALIIVGLVVIIVGLVVLFDKQEVIVAKTAAQVAPALAA